MKEQVATFGGGCFWCIEAVVQRLKGVEKVVSGYAGGKVANPSYREVCYGRTGHAEVVQVTFDSDLITYKDLIRIFMTSHDPTQVDGQGADKGTQYRSIILAHNDVQLNEAKEVIKELSTEFANKIVTEVVPLVTFYEAEDYHQDYYNQNSAAGYCRVVIDPKLRKLRAQYADRLKEELV